MSKAEGRRIARYLREKKRFDFRRWVVDPQVFAAQKRDLTFQLSGRKAYHMSRLSRRNSRTNQATQENPKAHSY